MKKRLSKIGENVLARRIEDFVNERYYRKNINAKLALARTKRELAHMQKRLKDQEYKIKEIERAKKSLTERLQKNCKKAKLNIGQPVRHKKHGNCLVTDLDQGRQNKIMITITTANGGRYRVGQNSLTVYTDLTGAIFD